MNQFPKQRILSKDKDQDWRENSVRGIINQSNFSGTGKTNYNQQREAYNGEMDTTDYSYVTNPYNSKKTKKRNFPARLRNYNIIKPVIDLLMGEKAKRPRNFQVVVANADAENRKLEEMHKAVVQNLQQQFINELNAMGMDTGVQSQPTEETQKVSRMASVNFKDARAIMGQQAVDYLSYYLELDDRMQAMFFDWLVYGEVYTYKGVNFDDVDMEVVPIDEIEIHHTSNTIFGEDGDWAVRRKFMSVNQVIDNFYDLLDEEQLEQIENASSQGTGMGFLFDLFHKTEEREDTDRLVEVIHVTWKSPRKVGLLTYPDEYGNIQEVEVDDSYKVDKEAGESVRWFWVNEVWEGYQIDGNIFTGIDPIEGQRHSMTNLSKVKLPYNSRKGQSIVGLGIPYQILYNIFHYRLELTIAKNKDKIALIEMNTIPKRHGWDEEDFMYYADAAGYAFIDSTAEGRNNERVTFNQYQVLDMSLSQYIGAQFELLIAIKQEWEDLIGVTRQRKGQIMASDGAGNTDQAIFQSSVMTEELFRKFEKFEEREMQGYLDLSKHAWADGKKGMYVTDDYRTEMLNIDPEKYREADFSVFVKNSSRENDKLQTMKQLALAFAQNGSQPSTVAEILDSTNFSNIKKLVKEVEEKQHQMEEAVRQHEQQMQAEKLESEERKRDEEQAFEAEENRLDRQNKLDIESMKQQAKSSDMDVNDNGVPDYIDVQKIAMEREKIASQERMHKQDIAMKDKELKSKPKQQKA